MTCGQAVPSQSFALLLAIDIGGSHVSAALCALDDLRVVQLTDASLSEVSSFDEFIELLYRLGRKVASSPCQLAGASLAVPGPFDCRAGMSLMQHKLQWLYKKDLRGALAARFGWDPEQLTFINDASAFLLGELNAGGAQGADRAAGLTLGTGIGAAFAIGGRCVIEGRGVPPGGEIWNLPYREATVEDLISTRSVKAEYLARTGRSLEVKEIAAAASSDVIAREVFEKLGRDLAQVIRDVILPFRPCVVVVGGGITRSAELFLPVTQRHVADLDLRVIASSLFDQANLIGAAAYWRERESSTGENAGASPSRALFAR